MLYKNFLMPLNTLANCCRYQYHTTLTLSLKRGRYVCNRVVRFMVCFQLSTRRNSYLQKCGDLHICVCVCVCVCVCMWSEYKRLAWKDRHLFFPINCLRRISLYIPCPSVLPKIFRILCVDEASESCVVSKWMVINPYRTNVENRVSS